MKLYKPKYKDRNGKTKLTQNWYLSFTGNRQTRRRLPAFSNKRASEKAAEKIEELLSSGDILSPDLQHWIETIPEKMRKQLVKFGLIGNRRLSENLGKSLSEHLADYIDGLRADNRKAAYIQQTEKILKRTLTGCRFQVFSDIDGNKVKTFLAKSRGPDGYGEGTYNVYLRNFKGFCGWLVREGRVSGTDPMKNQQTIKQTEFRKQRRALTIDEIQRLLKSTESAETRFFMTGHERALVYRLALEAGLRHAEIKSLTVSSFNLESKHPTVHIESSDTKGKRPADLILMNETAKAIRKFLRGKLPQAKAFSMSDSVKLPIVLRADLNDAGIEYTDSSDRDLDFHSLRHSFITNLALAGVHPAVAQKLARHSSIELTMKYYTHVLHKSEVEAINALSVLTYTCQKGAQGRTPTDGHGQKNLSNDSKTALIA